jgi:galactokinase
LLDDFSLLDDRFGTGADSIVARAPGRVNLIGEHTDYNGGYVLPFAIDRCTNLCIRPRSDHKVRFYASSYDHTVERSLPLQGQKRSGDWSDYLIGILIEFSRLQELPFGVDGVITSDVPIGAGLSSSAALEISLALGLCHVYRISIGDLDLVRLCQRVENEYVGTRCGIMDQLVSLLAADRSALFLNTDSLCFRNVPMPFEETSLLVVDTNVHRLLSRSGYNDRRRECETALALLREAFPDRGIRSLSSVGTILTERDWTNVLPSVLGRRVTHVVRENKRVLEATKALEEDNIKRLGELLFSSHASLRDLFEVSCAELDFLIDWAGEHGAIGARLVGGGFGGATLHLVPSKQAHDYAGQICSVFRDRFERETTIITVRAGPGAKELNACL